MEDGLYQVHVTLDAQIEKLTKLTRVPNYIFARLGGFSKAQAPDSDRFTRLEAVTDPPFRNALIILLHNYLFLLISHCSPQSRSRSLVITAKLRWALMSPTTIAPILPVKPPSYCAEDGLFPGIQPLETDIDPFLSVIDYLHYLLTNSASCIDPGAELSLHNTKGKVYLLYTISELLFGKDPVEILGLFWTMTEASTANASMKVWRHLAWRYSSWVPHIPRTPKLSTPASAIPNAVPSLGST